MAEYGNMESHATLRRDIPTNHLPECKNLVVVKRGEYLCICPELRSAQERGTARAYDRGVKAARDAVEALLHDDPCDCYECRALVAALAAIDGVSNGLGPKS
jgi:hypothetical protein